MNVEFRTTLQIRRLLRSLFSLAQFFLEIGGSFGAYDLPHFFSNRHPERWRCASKCEGRIPLNDRSTVRKASTFDLMGSFVRAPPPPPIIQDHGAEKGLAGYCLLGVHIFECRMTNTEFRILRQAGDDAFNREAFNVNLLLGTNLLFATECDIIIRISQKQLSHRAVFYIATGRSVNLNFKLF